MLDEKQIAQNWDALIIFIEDNFAGEREEKLLAFYNKFADRIAIAPASGQVSFHSCFPGGYVHHVLNMIKCTQKVDDLWKNVGGTPTYTEDELKFASLNHDLGKIGNLEYEQYIPVEEQWKRNRGNMYEGHSRLDYMLVQDRSIFLLQHAGLQMTQNEFLGIKLHDGLYDDGNKGYFMSFDVRNNLRTMLPYIMHWGDMMATKLEYESWLHTPEGIRYMDRGGNVAIKKNYPPKIKKTISLETNDSEKKTNVQSFEDLFGDIL